MTSKSMTKHLQQLFSFMQQENVFKLLFVILSITLTSAALISTLEPDLSFLSAIWWSIVTLTTVGYGDISPVTFGGRVIAVVIMFLGIGVLGMFSASLASLLITKQMKENRGMCQTAITDHIILCEWNHRTRAILKELRGDSKTKKSSIVLIADIAEKPIDDPLLFFVKGQVTEETLEQANLSQAKTVVILGDDTLEATSRDAKVVLSTLTIESMASNVYTVVELVDKANKEHCRRAKADEIIIGSELSSHLIASATLDHGISRIVSELLNASQGNELYAIPVPKNLTDKEFIDVMVTMKREQKATVLGIQKGRGGNFISNPDCSYLVTSQDYLVIVATDRPML